VTAQSFLIITACQLDPRCESSKAIILLIFFFDTVESCCYKGVVIQDPFVLTLMLGASQLSQPDYKLQWAPVVSVQLNQSIS